MKANRFWTRVISWTVLIFCTLYLIVPLLTQFDYSLRARRGEIGLTAYTNVFRYAPQPELWGVTFALILISPASSPAALMILEWYRGVGSLLVVAASAVMSVRLKALRVAHPIELGTIAFSLFLIFAPGFGVQYLIYVTPFLMLTHPKIAVWFSATSGVFLVLVYRHFMTQPFPFESAHLGPIPPPAAAIGFVSWAILVINFVKSYVLPAGVR